MELKEHKASSILNKLKQKSNCPKMLLTITNFAFSNMVQNLIHQLNLEFESKRGRPAYPRTLLLIVVLYCFSIDIANYTKMEDECEKNRFLLIVTCGLKPSRNSFANFLNKSDAKVIKKVFITTLVLLNDLHFLDFVKKLSGMHNNKLRREKELPEKRKKSSKKDLLGLKTVISI